MDLTTGRSYEMSESSGDDAQHASSSSETPQYPTSTPHLNPHSLRILSNPKSGRGLYTSCALASGTVVEISPVLLFDSDSYSSHGRYTILDSYTFKWGRMGVMALALGLGSLFNHSKYPNVAFHLDRERQCIRYTLTRDVESDEELCISYGAWGRQYEDDGDETDEEERRERDEVDFLRIGEERSESGSGSEDCGAVGENGRLHTKGDDRGAGRACIGQAHGDAAAASTATVNGEAGTSGSAVANSTPPPPMWRVTSLPDPSTVPLRLMDCYALIVPARSSSQALSFLRKRCSDLGRGRSLGCEEDAIRHAKTLSSSGDEIPQGQTKTLRALLCPVDGVDEGKLRGMLAEHSLADATLIRVQVADSPAPIKSRLAEWCAPWPVSLRSTSNVAVITSANGTSSPSTSLSAALALSAAPPKPSAFIDRHADTLFWTSRRTQWVISKLARCVLLAQEAENKGQVPVGVHVCPSLLPVDPQDGQSELGAWDSQGIPYSGGDAIEEDAYDTRVADGNPIKHAVGNAVRKVANTRAARREATNPSTLSSSTLLNGQDYLLTSLTLFTTHEPCVYCCMSLVHSRVRTLVFLKPSPGSGGCCGSELPRDRQCEGVRGGPYALQEQRGLNHRFEVWCWQGGLDVIANEVERVHGKSVDVAALLDLSRRGVVDP